MLVADTYEGRNVPVPPEVIYYELGCAFGKTPTEIEKTMEPDEIRNYWLVHLKKLEIQNKPKKGNGKPGGR